MRKTIRRNVPVAPGNDAGGRRDRLSVSRWRAARSPVDPGWRPGAPRTRAGGRASGLRFPVPPRSPTRGSCARVRRRAGEQTPPSFRVFGRRADCPLDSCPRGGLSARCKAHVLSSLWTVLVAQKAMCRKLFEKYHYVRFKLVTFPVVLPHDHPHV